MKLIDTHCHLYAKEFDQDIAEVMGRAVDNGVEHFFLPAIDSTTLQAMLDLEARYPGKCMAMAGLHPCSVKDDYKSELQWIADLLQKRPFAAIGEIGLDFYWDKTYTANQYDAFHQQIEWALHYKRPIVIHSRESMKESIAVVREHQNGSLHGIFHCFSGTLEDSKEIMGLGFYLGIGGTVTYKKSALPEILQEIGLSHIVLETDAPYLSPVPFRGKRNESSYLTYVVQKIAEATHSTTEEVAAMTTENAKRIFGI